MLSLSLHQCSRQNEKQVTHSIETGASLLQPISFCLVRLFGLHCFDGGPKVGLRPTAYCAAQVGVGGGQAATGQNKFC